MASCCGVVPMGSAPMVSNLATVSGCFMASISAALILFTMAAGVPAGANTANQGETS